MFSFSGGSDLSQARQVLETGQALDANNRSFATWLKKCGDAPPTNIGKHDEALAALLAAHEQQGYALMETVVEFLSRKTSVLGYQYARAPTTESFSLAQGARPAHIPPASSVSTRSSPLRLILLTHRSLFSRLGFGEPQKN